jgi:transposase
VARLIEQRFARRYSESQVWRILMSLGFSCQRPSGRALERDESAIQRWKQERGPALKKTL